MACRFLLLLAFIPALAFAIKPKVPWRKKAVFVLDESLSDEFNGSDLDETKWDPHGLRNPNTGCPRWNGPPSTAAPEYSTFFSAVTDPHTGEKIHKQYRVKKGKLELFISEKPEEYFRAREYYCNATTFHCNHDPNLPCYSTGFDGKPLRNPDGSFRGIMHDKCKREPFCIAHPEYVTGKERIFKRFVGAHLTSKKRFKYGYIEAKVRLPKSPSLTAVWMHDNDLVNGWCRWRKHPDPAKRFNVLECPSVTRSRRWQEIDLLEAMNTRIHSKRYTPNIHAFAMYKGEFSSADGMDNGEGLMGGGPIIMQENVFRLNNPNFSDVPPEQRRGNEFHWSPGSVYTLDKDWAAKNRVLGLYWSPKEIRFYIDGKEVKRVNNTLIHQSMFLDLSTVWNIPWGMQEPTTKEIRKSKSKIFYVKRWEVFTKGGEDPPSELPLDDVMNRRFENLYGDQLGGVFGRFPWWDDLTVTPTIPEQPDMMEPTPEPPNADLGDVVSEEMALLGTKSRDYFKSALDDVVARVKKQDSDLERAGGAGNLRFSTPEKPMTGKERRIAVANPERELKVEAGEMPKPLKNGAQTVFEFADPDGEAAGWATRDGSGRHISG